MVEITTASTKTRQKQSPGSVPQINCSSKFHKIQKKIPGPATSLRKRLWHKCLFLNFPKPLRIAFLQSTSWRLLLIRAMTRYTPNLFICNLKIFRSAKQIHTITNTCSYKILKDSIQQCYQMGLNVYLPVTLDTLTFTKSSQCCFSFCN